MVWKLIGKIPNLHVRVVPVQFSHIDSSIKYTVTKKVDTMLLLCSILVYFVIYGCLISDFLTIIRVQLKKLKKIIFTVTLFQVFALLYIEP